MYTWFTLTNAHSSACRLNAQWKWTCLKLNWHIHVRVCCLTERCLHVYCTAVCALYIQWTPALENTFKLSIADAINSHCATSQCGSTTATKKRWETLHNCIQCIIVLYFLPQISHGYSCMQAFAWVRVHISVTDYIRVQTPRDNTYCLVTQKHFL